MAKKKPRLVEKWEKQAKALSEFQKKADLEQKLNNILPEPELPEFEGKTIEKFKASWIEGKQQKVISERPMEIINYEIKRNPYLMPLFNLNHAKMYFDTKSEEFWLYVFSVNRKRILRKVKIEKHDIESLLAFCIWNIFPKKSIKAKMNISVNRRLRNKIAELKRKEANFYGEPSI